jgi:tetratricopeptide (TPR) repeat protein
MKRIRVLFLSAILLCGYGYTNDDAMSLVNSGDAHYRKGAYDVAILDYTKAIRLDSNYVAAYLHRGNAYNQKDDGARAIADYNRVIRLDPNNITAFYGRGQAYIITEEYDKAAKDFRAALRINPNHAPSKEALAEIQKMMEVLEEYHPSSY